VSEIDEAPIDGQASRSEMTATVLAEGDGQKNRRLVLFSFRLLNRPSEKRAECAQECAQKRVPKRVVCG
jgi:hypothetical protein